MSISIGTLDASDNPAWDRYVDSHPGAELYHLWGWKEVIEKTYGHDAYYLTAVDPTRPKSAFVGVLPLVHLKHFIFGNNLISLPFFDLGGVLADNEEAGFALISEAVRIGTELKAETIELRHTAPTNPVRPPGRSALPHGQVTRSHKVRMLLDLPESSETLMKSFRSKLRSQIKKPIKDGLKSKIGALELLDDFYHVFSINMRDLGSPVHSSRFMQNVLEAFPDSSRIVVVYQEKKPLASSLVVKFKDILENPWASALRQYSHLSPNMLLYWTMLEYACDNGCRRFDFGRSSPDEGTYKFKTQWGAKPTPLNWQYIPVDGKAIDPGGSEKSKFQAAIKCWKKLPVPVANRIGPRIRKHIGL